MLRIARIFLNGSAAISRRVVSLRWAVASPIISMRRTTASCFCVSGRELRLRGVLHIGRNEARRFQNIAQSAKLISLHKRKPQWREYARVQNGSAISREKDAGRNPPGDPRLPRPRRPSPEARRRRRVTIRSASPASPHHCQVQLPLGRRNRTRPAAGCDAFRKTGAIALSVRPGKPCRRFCAWADPKGRRPPHQAGTAGRLPRGHLSHLPATLEENYFEKDFAVLHGLAQGLSPAKPTETRYVTQY